MYQQKKTITRSLSQTYRLNTIDELNAYTICFDFILALAVFLSRSF